MQTSIKVVKIESDRSDIDEGRLSLAQPKKKLMSSRTIQWTSVRSPATSVGNALKEVKTSGRLSTGIKVTKITTRGQLKQRIITLSKDKFALFVTHSAIKKSEGMVSTMAKTLNLPLITRKGIRGFVNQQTLREQYVRYIDVADIVDISIGAISTQKLENARTVNRLKTGQPSEVDLKAGQIVSIVHSGNQTLDVIVPDRQDRQELINSVLQMCRIYHEAKKNVSNEALLLRYIWYDVDQDRNGLISLSEFNTIMNRINFHVKNPKDRFKAYMKEQNKAHGLSYVETMTLLQKIKRDEGLCLADKLWVEIFGNVESVSAAKFLTDFLHKAQGQKHMSMDDAREIIDVVSGMEMNHTIADEGGAGDEPVMTRARFEVFLFDLMNSAYDPWALDMDGEVALEQPISHYWINTSHNTYLTGDQLKSRSSVEAYVKALRRGCKCLELDCWDGEKSKDGKYLPVVFHGHTLTSKILFEDIIRAVKSYVKSHPYTYPVILSLENHCSHDFQRAMAQTLKDILEDLLYIPTENDKTSGDLPSPEDLRGKIVIKGKRPPDEEDSPTEEGKAEDDEEDQYASTSPISPGSSPGKLPKKLPKIVSELAGMTLFHGTKFKDFEKSLVEPSSHMHSIGESKIPKIIAKNALNTDLWRQYNVKHMTRTYPAGSRVDSSNYNPVLAWYVGSQLVALNFQTPDIPLILNDGMFRQNQGCGYILKPPSVLGKEESTVARSHASGYEKDTLDVVMEGVEEIVCGADATTIDFPLIDNHMGTMPTVKHRSVLAFEGSKTNTVKLKIRVLGASCLPKPRGHKSGETIDPYVKVSLHDVARDSSGKAMYVTAHHTTSVVNDNGFCPIWPEAKSMEFEVSSPEVALVNFALSESDVTIDDKVADAAIPISCLRTGYRSIQVFDENHTRTGPFGFATLLVEIQSYS